MLSFGDGFWRLILVLDSGARFFYTQFWHSVFAFNFGGQFWRLILEFDFFI